MPDYNTNLQPATDLVPFDPEVTDHLSAILMAPDTMSLGRHLDADLVDRRLIEGLPVYRISNGGVSKVTQHTALTLADWLGGEFYSTDPSLTLCQLVLGRLGAHAGIPCGYVTGKDWAELQLGRGSSATSSKGVFFFMDSYSANIKVVSAECMMYHKIDRKVYWVEEDANQTTWYGSMLELARVFTPCPPNCPMSRC